MTPSQLVRKILLHSFIKIIKIPFYKTILGKVKMDIYFCPFLKISVDFISMFERTYYYYLSLKTIKIAHTILSIKGPFLVTIYAVNNSIIILYYDCIYFRKGSAPRVLASPGQWVSILYPRILPWKYF